MQLSVRRQQNEFHKLILLLKFSTLRTNNTYKEKQALATFNRSLVCSKMKTSSPCVSSSIPFFKTEHFYIKAAVSVQPQILTMKSDWASSLIRCFRCHKPALNTFIFVPYSLSYKKKKKQKLLHSAGFFFLVP